MAKPNKLKILLPYFVIFLIAGLVLSQGINKPLYGHHDWNGVFYGNIARNYLNLGLIKTKLGQVTSTRLLSGKFSFYTHYPPLLPLSIAFSYWLFGISALTTRLVPIIFSAASILMLFKISQQLKFSLLSSLASLIVIFTPMYRYFSKMPDQEAPLIFFSLLSLYYYLKLLKTPTKKLKLKFYLSVIFNGLTAWAGYFLYPLLTLYSYFFHKKSFKTSLKAIYILIVIFFLHLTHTYILTGSFVGGGLIQALLLRLNLAGSSPGIPQFTWPKYLAQQAHWLTIYYTASLLIISLISLVLIAKNLVKKIKLTQPERIILLLLAWGLSYPLIFSNVVFVHEYFNFFFMPFLALSLAWLINQLQSRQPLLAIILALVFTGLIYQERLPFYKALEVTQAHKPGYQLGTLINQTVPQDQPAHIIASDEFIDSQSVFIKFYSDRQINFVDTPSLDSQFVFYE